MQKCRICGSTDFYKEAGYYFCQTCQTQNEDIREEVLELRADSSTRLRKTRIKQFRLDGSGEELGWTSWELYNLILIGLTNELIELGIPSDIKLTVLQLWATYLGKIEVAFISTKRKCMPKLARRYKKRDADIVYGKAQSQKSSRKRKKIGSSTNTSVISSGPSEGSSMRDINRNKRLLATADYDRFLQSQESSEGDGLSLFSQSVYSIQSSSIKSSEYEGKVQFSSHAKEEARKIKRLSKDLPRSERVNYRKKHISSWYKMGPHIVTPMRLWAIIYLALRIHNYPIQLGDMLRYGREGHLSYYKLDHLLPPEVTITANEKRLLTQTVEITHKGMRKIIAEMAKFLGVWNIGCPDFLSLINRYCQELGLPRGIQLYAERLIALSPPKMIFDTKNSYIPNYEGRAIAFIIVVLKTLLALDGITEYHISRIAEKMNRGVECKCYESNAPCIIVHGGAGNFSDSIVIEKMTGCKKAAINGYKKLLKGETSVDAVETALWWLECDEFFNCSYGSVLNEIGKVEMDASIMDGFSFKCGSVAAVSDIEHPITLAKYVMNNFPNSIFVGNGAKNLAKHANLNWISEGNMISPLARIAFQSEEKGKLDTCVDDQISVDFDMLKNSFGTVGCVAYDGYSIAAGTSTGGLNKKLVGRVGDTPILGCGTFATRNVGCSLTGHGESIIKLGLAREIVEDIERNLSSEEALHKHFSCMLKKFEQVGGGIVLQSNGRWATYFTSDKMPYAVIENDLVTYGARLYEEKREIIATERGVLNAKLFSFHEWQRYIECRKTVLVHAHFPTKMKYSPDSSGIDDLYLKFFEFIASKSNRKELDIRNSRNLLPEELINAMTKHVTSLDTNDLSPPAIDIFPPSLTPLHSYLQHLLEHPFYDIPNIVRSDFFDTKIGYMTRPDSLIELAMKCDIQLEIIDSNAHFLEKYVPSFKPPNIPSVDELKQFVNVQDDSKDNHEIKSESLNDYLHANIPCAIKVDAIKKQLYENIDGTMKSSENDTKNVFTFTETLPNGKLAIPCDSDSESEEENSNFTKNVDQQTVPLGNKFCNKYNIHLSLSEKESINKPNTAKIRYKKLVQFKRNSKGQFVKGGGLSVKIENIDGDCSIEKENVNFYNTQTSAINNTDIAVENIANKDLFMFEDINIGDIDIDFNVDDLDINNDFLDTKDYLNLSDISLFNENNDNFTSAANKKTNVINAEYKFFRPFKQYWMYHCVFSRVRPKRFAVFERALPRTFRWLLNECALVVEMSTEDLYEQVCLIESYHSNVLKSLNSKSDTSNNIDQVIKKPWNFILSKW